MTKEYKLALNDYQELKKLINNILDCPSKGGNISVKLKDDIIIKSSGVDLKSEIDRVSTKDKSFEFYKKWTKIDYLKPSMEINFHKVIKSKYVLHYHPVYILLLQDDLPFDADVIDYIKPGSDKLTEAVSKCNKKVIYLKNHGVILHSDSLQEIKELYFKLSEFNIFKIIRFNYTPDMVVLENSTDLALHKFIFRVFKNITKIEELDQDDVNNLLNDENEMYRISK
nr:MAG TPA: aldolase [Caudoviricetes sp.]